MQAIAQIYYNQGFSPLPISFPIPGKEKAPVYGCMWKQWSRERILKEFERKDVWGLGLKCDGFEVVDIDNKLGNAYDVLQYIKDNVEFFDELAILKTQSGGFHIPFRCSEMEGSQKLASVLDVYGEWQGVVETKGIGGYIVTYPTKGYKPIQRNISFMPTFTTFQRSLLLNVCRSLNRKPVERKERMPDFKTDSNGVIELARSCLRNAGWKFSGKYVSRPGKEGTSATFGKVAPGVFYCFTANGHPFEENHGYSAFQVVMKLMFNGDYRSTMDYLKEKLLI